MEVTSVINSYSATGSVNAGANIVENPGNSTTSLGGARSWAHSPTVTYQPLTGQKFTSSLLRPIPPIAVFRMVQAGWPVPLVFKTVLRSINGIQNQSLGRAADPRMISLEQAMDRIQRSGAMDVRAEETKEGESVLIILRNRQVEGSILEDQRTVRGLLGLEAEASEFTIAFGSVPRDSSEIAILTRSMLEILLELAIGIDVPPADAAEGRVLIGQAPPGEPATEPLIHVRSGDAAPEDAFAAIPYRNRWFWIDDTDPVSKGRFTFLMILFSLAESGPATAGPLLTVSTGR
jgi:hypothetical protein